MFIVEPYDIGATVNYFLRGEMSARAWLRVPPTGNEIFPSICTECTASELRHSGYPDLQYISDIYDMFGLRLRHGNRQANNH